MDIFESLENLNVSEECFDDIISIVEELLSEDVYSAIDKYAPEKDKERLRTKAENVEKKNYKAEVDKEEKKTGRKLSSTYTYAHGNGFPSDSPREKAKDRVNDRKFYNKNNKNDFNKHTSCSISDQQCYGSPSSAFAEPQEGDVLDNPRRKEMNTARGMIKHAKKLKKQGKGEESDKYLEKGSHKKMEQLKNELDDIKQSQKEYQDYTDKRNSSTSFNPDTQDAPDIDNAADDSYYGSELSSREHDLKKGLEKAEKDWKGASKRQEGRQFAKAKMKEHINRLRERIGKEK